MVRPNIRHLMAADFTFNLSGCAPIARGGERLVFRDPTNPARLIKLPHSIRSSGFGAAALRRTLVPNRDLKRLIDEVRAYRSLPRPERGRTPPFPATHGLVQTTKGIGLLMDAVTTGVENELAPNLREIILTEGIRPETVNRMNRLAAELQFSQPLLSDFRARNIVLAGDGRLLIIDGLGHVARLTPIEKLAGRWLIRLIHKGSKDFRRSQIERILASFAAANGLAWTGREFLFLPDTVQGDGSGNFGP